MNISLETQAKGVDVVLKVTGPIDNMKLSYTSAPRCAACRVKKSAIAVNRLHRFRSRRWGPEEIGPPFHRQGVEGWKQGALLDGAFGKPE